MATNGDQVARRFTERLRELRLAQDMSQETLAQQASQHGVQLLQTTIAKIEAGQRAVRIGEAWALSRALGLALDDLVSAELGGYSEAELRAEIADVDRKIREGRPALAAAEMAAARAVDAVRAARGQMSALEARLSELGARLYAMVEPDPGNEGS